MYFIKYNQTVHSLFNDILVPLVKAIEDGPSQHESKAQEWHMT